MKGLALFAVLAFCLQILGNVQSHSAYADVNNVGDVKITVMGFNAQGTDTIANRNAEYVWLKNVTADPVNVDGWKLSDGYGIRFTFDDSSLPGLVAADRVILPAGESIVIYTGAGSDTTPDNATHAVYLNKSGNPGHIYNNTSGEKVSVFDKDGTTVDSLSYNAYGINPTP